MGEISFIIPAYNAEKTLGKCVDSILAMNLDVAYEIIIVDDGSKDRTYEICENYRQNDNIKIIHQKNGGVASARNHGLSLATGKWLAFVDSDDQINSDEYKKFLSAVVLENSDCYIANYMVVTGEKATKADNYKKFKLHGREQINKLCAACFGAELAPEYMHGMDGSGFPWDKLYKRSIIEENGLKFESDILGDDVWFNFQYFRYVNTVICYDDFFIYKYFIFPDSMTHSFIPINRIDLSCKLYVNQLLREQEDIIKNGLYVQLVRMMATAFKHYFMNKKSGMSKMRGGVAFYKWKKQYKGYAAKTRNCYLPLKMKIFRVIIMI